jgi:disulfide bond formation protein DsbB
MQRIFEKILFITAWIRIFLSPTIGGLVLAAIIYYNKPDELGLIIASIFAFLGFILGIIVANKISNKYDPMEFLFRVDASPDLDNLKQAEK